MPELTKARDQKLKTKNNFIWLFFALLIVLVYFFALRSIPLLGPDEPRYAQVAREMFERRDFITPTLGGFDWFEKPALLYWLEIVSYKLFGVSEFAARFGSALCGLGTIFCLWILGRKAQSRLNENQSVISDFTNWLFLVAASSIGLLAFSRAASFDIILTFPVTASLAAFFVFEQSENKNSKTFHFSLFAFYFFAGVALLAKGLIGIVFPFAIVAFYFLLRRKMPDKTFVFSLFWGTVLSLAVASLWYAPMYSANGWKFIDEFFVQHQYERFTSNKFQHPQPVWFFLLVLPLMTLPWLPFFSWAIWRLISDFKFQISNFKFRNERRIEHREPQIANLKIFAFAWLVVPLVFFSFSGSKLPGYILPALPAAIILTAETVWRFARGSQRRTRALQAFALATFICVIIALQFFVRDYARGDTVKNLIETANARGFADAKIYNFNDVFHGAEFYGAGRLIRTTDGKQRRFYAAAEIAGEMKSERAANALVLTPLEFLPQLKQDETLDAEVLTDNGETAIAAARVK